MQEFETQRHHLWEEIDAPMNLRKLSAARDASHLLREWQGIEQPTRSVCEPAAPGLIVMYWVGRV